MRGFACAKPVSLSGVDYVPGDYIPEEAILPGRVLALKRSGYIVIAPGADDGMKAGQGTGKDWLSVPVNTAGGVVSVEVSGEALARSFALLQATEKEARALATAEEDENVLVIVAAIDRRKNVLAEVKERLETLRKGGDADGGDVHV